MTAAPASAGPGSADAATAAVARAQEYQLAALRQVAAAAQDESEPVGRAAGWLAVEQQCARILRMSAAMPGVIAMPERAALVAEHEARVHELQRRAEAERATLDPGTRAAASRRVGIRVAIAGKGGSGKTFIAATLARVLVESGRRVLAVDLDTSPGLSYGLGLPSTDGGLPAEAIDTATGWLLRSDLTPDVAVEQLAATDAAGVRVLSMGKVSVGGSAALMRSVGPLGMLLYSFCSPGWDIVVDLDAGLRATVFGYANFADLLVMVLNPNAKSTLTVRRLLGVAGERPHLVVANAWRDERAPDGVDPRMFVPHDARVMQCERDGVPVVERFSDAPSVDAVRELARVLLERGDDVAA